MHAALALAERGRGRTAPNPNVGCVIVQPAPAKGGGKVVGRGWTQPGGRPHAEAMALAAAGEAARGSTVYTTLEPCAHVSPRGPACSDLLVEAGVARVVAALGDPDPRTDGRGHDRLRAGGIVVETGVEADGAARSMAGFLTRRSLGRPHVTLKLATSLDGCLALANGESKWITGAEARAHAHLERARHEAILVGRGTYEADAPKLDVRLAGLEGRSPRRLVLSSRHPRFRGGDGWEMVTSPQSVATLETVDHLLVEGGAQTAAAFLAADLVDRLLLYRAPILIGGGKPAIGDIGLASLADAHRRWRLRDRRMLGIDTFEEFERVR
ncbi:bifunctional diaminohydroxyphosphoribosylaminopyrimidine deaminase/5-amino-6-(5-phosphoribosylamino)uracil reductase RibD [Sphingomonas sp.]|jgi:diaminohydroxyphosphoribosylaminopyrimidine deaminase/5-amino-6-(5-phosphoribosylamino)uracil reductase|uniref:bifunctional diaminohydroxyphosphoribosylaminopyrimidine deaminase/5-amino-6-(5-phosphoribosylamino)uracil reductase RibD n=1 Tax=Sphingomonas sp. TaxID=28214 RepID=UPI002E2FD5F3|nr:bifunctional diaminohydroxyphosphoribosylaminopyrimidine deaminase/5-amino-6-(5-phosphoribosylamino)uracil reductase RibD [Sphingomonas sp.]HEX4695160.1 bifunctional diaminohydroxyphosphoribosylaminopyrimidine deaminase/5-amino-6-(5-phosphoribosylamino)uracil reductase RibD [Sphingomonas sp.]